ncbi:nitrite reductase small subunit NirD [Nocardioides yefusunii]|uniref:Nitrite reductase small subunit NirD n=1 Tax=Nocardioides yefusunii TaxID=2500546 RepID=A0ABW1QW22_9ACTN|nr:nitrite reductase small subunit NirD [Nocardioides yefusunii]
MGRDFQPVCQLGDLELGRGVVALVHGQAVAIFRLPDDVVVAIGNHDPFSRGAVLARGMVGVRDDVHFVATATHRHTFDLHTGRCLDDPTVTVPSFPAKVVDGTVLVGPRTERRASA